jgi:N-acetylmuramoyl-L-alanine amidase
MRKITGIIIHCTATRPEWMEKRPLAEKVAEVRRWHVKDRGWRDIGYHYLIDRDGKVATGRPIEQDGAHVQGHNRGTIGVALIGGHGSAASDMFADHFTAAQDKALRKLVDDLRAKHGRVAVTGHNQYANKACPGFSVARWLEDGKPKPAPITQPSKAEKPAATGLWAQIFAWFMGARQ